MMVMELAHTRTTIQLTAQMDIMLTRLATVLSATLLVRLVLVD